MARAFPHEGQAAQEEQRNDGCGDGPGAPTDPHRHPERDQHHAHDDHDRPGGEGGDQDEPCDEGAEYGAGGPDGGVRPDDGTGLGQRGEPDLDHDRWDRRQDRGRREEPDQAEADDRNRPGRSGRANEVHEQRRRHRRQPAGNKERADEATGVAAIGRPPPGPSSHRDPGEDHTDDASEHLEADPQVGRKQSPGEDLEDEDRGGGDEDE